MTRAILPPTLEDDGRDPPWNVDDVSLKNGSVPSSVVYTGSHRFLGFSSEKKNGYQSDRV